MNEYKFDDLVIGLEESFEYVVTQDKVDMFRNMSGDYNPLHNNRDFALAHNFKDKVVYGMLTSSLISTMGGVYLPGKYCIIHQIKTKFYKPVYVGDKLIVKGTVDELNDTVKVVVIKIAIINQNNEKVLKGTLEAGFTE